MVALEDSRGHYNVTAFPQCVFVCVCQVYSEKQPIQVQFVWRHHMF